jgi:glycine cleavage system H protein
MDGFSYHNIFDTKGLEYLVIIAFLLLLIPFWMILNKNLKIVEHIRKAAGVLTANILRIPQGLFYSRNHTWAYMGKSGIASIGLDDLLLHITGEVNVRHLKNKDDIIRKGDLIAEVSRQGKSLNIFSPVSGKILEANSALHHNHELPNKDPYGEGWLYNLKPSNWVEEIPSCFLSEDATNWLKNELDRYKDFVAINIGKYSAASSFAVLQDGGEIADNSLSALPDGMWNDFQKEFLDLKETN